LIMGGTLAKIGSYGIVRWLEWRNLRIVSGYLQD
jgi:hypothetical protein